MKILSSVRKAIREHQKIGKDAEPLNTRLGVGPQIPEDEQEKMTSEDCIALLQAICESRPDVVVSRDWFRKNSGIADATWTKYFGKFNHFKQAANVKIGRRANGLLLHVSKHSSADDLAAMTKEIRSYGKKYLKPKSGRWKTILLSSDTHDKECDPFAQRVFLDVAKRLGGLITDVFHLGDLYDCPEFGKYTVDPRNWDPVGRIKWVDTNHWLPLRKYCPDAEFTLLGGNHESTSLDTEILCKSGWVAAENITAKHEVASYDLSTGEVEFNPPVDLTFHDNAPLFRVTGDLSDELVSNKHRINVDNVLTPVTQMPPKIKQTRLRYSSLPSDKKLDISFDHIRLLTWLIMDGTMVRKKLKDGSGFQNNCRLQWKLSIQRKIDSLCKLLERMGIPFTFRPAAKGGINKLQPYYICVYRKDALWALNYLEGKKEFPDHWTHNVGPEDIKVILEAILETDGCRLYNHIAWTTTSKKNVDFVQLSCILNGIPCKYKECDSSSSGFKNGAIQYHASIFDKGVFDRRYVSVEEAGSGPVVSIATKSDTLITRRNGKVSFTGNSRISALISAQTPAVKVVLSDLHGMTVPSFLGLDKYEINYIANGDLKAIDFSKSSARSELERNYHILYGCFLGCHYPTGQKKGLPGAHGHHHRHMVWTHDSPIYGAYEWHQLGAMHRRHAEYTDGERWNNGFAIVHIDSKTKAVEFEYINVGTTQCVAAGKFYTREKDE